MTSHRGIGSTVLRASDRPACPAGENACRAQTGRPYVFCLWMGAGDMGPVDGATDTVTGAEAQSLPPPDAKGSGWVERPPILNLDWWSRPSRLPDYLNGQIGNEAWQR